MQRLWGRPDMAASDKQGAIRALLGSGRMWLAPMAGVTDATFRAICVEHGCPLATTEMVSATAIRYGSAKTRTLYQPAPGERRVAVQLFGSDPDEMAHAAAAVEHELGPRLALVDVNMGCPVPKVTKRGAGSALMRDPKRAAAIVRAIDAAVSVPVTAKMRRGWDAESESCVDLALRLEEAGTALLTVHGRTAGQLYRGRADWGCIARVRQAVSIPVMGNGDIATAEEAASRIEQTGVDGVMVARGARGNPWIFSQARALARGDAPHVPTATERIEQLRAHCERFYEWRRGPGSWHRQGKGDDHSREPSLAPMRSHAMWYLAGLPHAARLREAAGRAETLADWEALCDSALDAIGRFEEQERAWAERKQPEEAQGR